MNTDRIIEHKIEARKSNAKELLSDQDKFEKFLKKLERKLKHVPIIGEKVSDLPILILLVRSYMSGEYTEVPAASIISILAALIYFVSPVDLLPDPIPVIGVVDDAAVLAFAANMVHDDVEEYREWCANQK